MNNSEEGKDHKRKEIQKLLNESNHPLADGIMCLTHDINLLKEGQEFSKRAHEETQRSISNLYKVIVGDKEFDTEGLIQKNEKSKEAHKAMEKRVDEIESTVKKEIFRMKTIGAAIVVGWSVMGDYIKMKIFGSH